MNLDGHRIQHGIAGAFFVLAATAFAGPPTQGVASLRLLAPAGACEKAALGSLTSSRRSDGAFEFGVELARPGTYRLECGSKFDLYLAPGDRLTFALDDKGKVAFSGRGAAANEYASAEASLSMPAFLRLAPRNHAEFVKAWQSLYDQDRRRLREAERRGAHPDFVEREAVRARFRWAKGRVMFPFFHWRETDEASIVPDPEVSGLVKSLPLADPRWWDLPEHQEILDAHIHALARDRLRTVPALKTGDNRWLRAGLDVLGSEVASAPLRLRQMTHLIAKHVEDDGSRALEPILDRWMALSPDPESVKRVREQIASDRSHRDGHAIAVYREVSGVPLEVHVLEPAASGSLEARPAMLWLHGGSATEGMWWWSPGITAALLDQGVVVVAVEMTTGNRFDADADQLSDASAAYLWLRDHAAEHRIDPRRIGVAGFSSGASVALLLGARGAAPASPARPSEPPPRPAAMVVMGACANPLSQSEDGWFRKSVGRVGSPADFSPLALVAPGQPRLLAIHATADEYCAYGEMKDFVQRYVAAGNEAELVSVPGASHFFGFYHKAGQQQTRAAIAAAMRRWGFSSPATAAARDGVRPAGSLRDVRPGSR